MGLVDTLFGTNTEPEKKEQNSPTKVQNYYFVNTDPGEKDSILDYQLIFGPHPEREGWGILRTNNSHYFDENDQWLVLIYETGDVIMQGDIGYKVHLGRIGPEKYVEEKHYDKFEIMELPSQFVGVELPERSEWSDEQLKELTLSLGMSREL